MKNVKIAYTAGMPRFYQAFLDTGFVIFTFFPDDMIGEDNL
jgi:hypothetical protein